MENDDTEVRKIEHMWDDLQAAIAKVRNCGYRYLTEEKFDEFDALDDDVDDLMQEISEVLHELGYV